MKYSLIKKHRGGKAEANSADVADWEQAEKMVSHAVEKWGGLDALICNAGFLRDRMLVGLLRNRYTACFGSYAHDNSDAVSF